MDDALTGGLEGASSFLLFVAVSHGANTPYNLLTFV